MTGTKTVMGLMSGTSMDGIDAALLKTDGMGVIEAGPAHAVPYDDATRALISQALEDARCLLAGEAYPRSLIEAERAVTLAHGIAVKQLLDKAACSPDDIDLIGFHGQTVLHRPPGENGAGRGFTIQLGDGAFLARLTGVDVIDDFRSADMAAGGQGAPLAPLYHEVLARGLAERGPIAVLNIGGVANVTYVPERGGTLLAFDIGPGNGPLDDWVGRHTGARFDRDGALAARGDVDENVLISLLKDPFFGATPPKSLDRQDFTYMPVESLSLEDGAATLTALIAAAPVMALCFFPEPPEKWIVCGGGRHNRTLMESLSIRLEAPVLSAEDVGWHGDFIEAQAFAYLAMRVLLGLPLSLPTTTGVSAPVTGGRWHRTPG